MSLGWDQTQLSLSTVSEDKLVRMVKCGGTDYTYNSDEEIAKCSVARDKIDQASNS